MSQARKIASILIIILILTILIAWITQSSYSLRLPLILKEGPVEIWEPTMPAPYPSPASPSPEISLPTVAPNEILTSH